MPRTVVSCSISASSLPTDDGVSATVPSLTFAARSRSDASLLA